MTPQLYCGARVAVSINNSVVAAAHVASWTIDTSANPIETVDAVFPLELAPQRVRVSMNLKVYRTPDNDPVVTEIAPLGNQGSSQTEQSAFLQSKYISLEIKDDNDQTIMYLPKAWVVRRSAGVNMGDFMAEDWSIISMGYIGPRS